MVFFNFSPTSLEYQKSLVFETPSPSKFPMTLHVVGFLKQHHAICISEEGGNYVLNSTVVSCYFNMLL